MPLIPFKKYIGKGREGIRHDFNNLEGPMYGLQKMQWQNWKKQ